MKYLTRQQQKSIARGLIVVSIVLQWLCANLAAAELAPNKNRDTVSKDALVKIYTVSSTPDYFNPWRMSGPEDTSGSGCIIAGSQILTSAHVVADQTFIQVRRYGQAKRYKASVQKISHDADLALLTVEDQTFFREVTPLAFGDFAETQQEVLVYGFPFGGDSLSITKGVLSRVEHRYYTHSSSYLLAGQIDAAINPGNSGGPVLVDGKIVGVVMQTYKANYSENIGYMVPMPIIQHFLQDIADGRYDGFPDLGLVSQNMENPDLKRKYGLAESQTGVLIVHVFSGSPAEGQIQPGDVLLTIDGHPVADDGTVDFRAEERTRYVYYVDLHQLGETLPVEVFRQGEVKQLTLTLNQTKEKYALVPAEKYEQLPRYFIYGGIVFSPLTKNLLEQWGPNWPNDAPLELVAQLSNWPDAQRQEVVVALKVLAADVNQGYHSINTWLVSEVNGQKIKDFNDFFQLVTQVAAPQVIFTDDRGFQVVLDRQKAEESRAKILQTYHLESDRSPDLRAFSSKP